MKISEFKRHVQYLLLEPISFDPAQDGAQRQLRNPPQIPAAEVLWEMGQVLAAMLSIAVVVHLACTVYASG